MKQDAAWLNVIVQETFFVHGTKSECQALCWRPHLLLSQVKVAVRSDEWPHVAKRHASLHDVDVQTDLEVLQVAYYVILITKLLTDSNLR